ncbi:glycosyltransferase 2, partial [Sarracenia purpurea var. burkii]
VGDKAPERITSDPRCNRSWPNPYGAAQGRIIYRVLAFSRSTNASLIWVYIPATPANQYKRLGWITVFEADLGSNLYWLLTQKLRYSCVKHSAFAN